MDPPGSCLGAHSCVLLEAGLSRTNAVITTIQPLVPAIELELKSGKTPVISGEVGKGQLDNATETEQGSHLLGVICMILNPTECHQIFWLFIIVV